jgi:hypothetical protein
VPTATPTLSSQELYVENSSGSAVSFGVFPSNASGTPPPTRTITVSGLGTLPTGSGGAGVQGARIGLAFSPASVMSVGNAGQILQFSAPTGGGAVAAVPTNVITTSSSSSGQLQSAIPGLAYDSSGNLYVATFNPVTAGSAAIDVFGVGASAGATTTRVITSSQMGGQNVAGIGDPEAVAVDSKGYVYVALFPNGGTNQASIVVFPPGANGNVSPTQLIQGANTGLPQASVMLYMDLAVDANQNIYVVYSTPSSAGILTFAAGANGNVAPTGSLTQASAPSLQGTSGIALDSNLNTYVTNQLGASLQFFGTAASSITPLATVSGFNTNISNPLVVRFGP